MGKAGKREKRQKGNNRGNKRKKQVQVATATDPKKLVLSERNKRGAQTKKARAVEAVAKSAPHAADRYGELWRVVKDTPAGHAFSQIAAKLMVNLNFSEEVAAENNKQLKRLIDYPPVPHGTVKAKVSPPMAWAAMIRSTKNRHMRRQVVENYAEVMTKGKWVYNGQPIIFSVSGHLLTGQHRLVACILSGESFETDLKFGITDEAAATIDVGARWTPADTLSRVLKDAEGIGGYYNLLSGTLAWIDRYNVGLPGARTKHLLNTRALELARQFPDTVRSVKIGMRIASRFRPVLTPGTLGFIHWLFHRIDGQQASTFFLRFEQGIGFTGKDDPIYMLRETISRMIQEDRGGVRETGKARRATSVYVIAIFIKTWNSFRKNEKIKQLRWVDGEAFPKAE